MKVIETRPREIGFVLLGHCQNLLDDPRWGLMLWLFIGPTGVYMLDFSCSDIQFYLLLSPYLCFISLLYLDLYVLEDDALIS